MSIKAIIMDLDYTLIDAGHGIYLSIKHALKEMGYADPNYDHCMVAIGHGLSLADIFKSLRAKGTPEENQTFQTLFVEHAKKLLIEHTQLFDSVPPFLHKASVAGYKLAIVTSKYRHGLDDVLHKFQIHKFFDFHLAGDEIEHPKPHPMGIEKALAVLNVGSDEAVYVGDSIIDAEAAHRAGVKFVAVLTGHTKKDSFSGYTCAAILTGLHELLDVLLAPAFGIRLQAGQKLAS